MSISPKNIKKGKRVAIVWIKKYEKNIVFGVALLLVSVLSFEFGVISSERNTGKTLVIEKPAQSLAQIKKEVGVPEGETVAGAMTGESKQAVGTHKEGDSVADLSSCTFVGSKNSNKYHSPSCSYAKRIKPENRVCFENAEEASGRGYIPGCIQ